MISINYPEPGFRIRTDKDKEYIFDSLRKKWLLLTPEEWVRQNFIQYMIKEKGYPSSLIAQEKVIRLGDLKKRFDILVYDTKHRPWMMVECKGAAIRLDDAVLQQVLRYNQSVPVEFIIISNGNDTYGWHRTDNLKTINELPFMQ